MKKLASVAKIAETKISAIFKLPDKARFFMDPLLKKIKGKTIMADITE